MNSINLIGLFNLIFKRFTENYNTQYYNCAVGIFNVIAGIRIFRKSENWL